MIRASLLRFRPGMLALATTFLFGCAATPDDVEGGHDESEAGDQTDPIVGGTAANIADYPWQISLQVKSGSGGSHICGGSILNESWILTAQHCTHGSTASQLRIAAGMSKLSQVSSSAQVRNVAKIIEFPGYVDASKGKDAALLQLSSPLDLSGPNAKAIPIMTTELANAGLDAPGVMATVSGWGTLSSNGSSPDTLQRVSVPVISNAKAQAAYSQETITADQLAAAADGKDSCQGDSGGPLVVPNSGGGMVLAGIVSWGYGCADKSYPGMYGRVSSFASWINQYVQTATPQPPTDPTQPTDPTDPPKPAGINESVTGTKGNWRDFQIQIPSGTSQLVVKASGGSGDADLYVRYNALPTSKSFDCRPYKDGNNEACTISAPKAGTWYVSLYGYANFSNVSLTAKP